MAEPIWLARARTHAGPSQMPDHSRIPGPAPNPTIAGWMAKLKAPWKDDETACCCTGEPAPILFDADLQRARAGGKHDPSPFHPVNRGALAEKRSPTAPMLEAAAYFGLYGPDERTAFLQALAAAKRGDALPLVALAYSDLGIDPDTLVGAADGTWHGAAYVAVSCSDDGEGPLDPDRAAREILDQAKAFRPHAPRRLRLYFAERVLAPAGRGAAHVSCRCPSNRLAQYRPR